MIDGLQFRFELLLTFDHLLSLTRVLYALEQELRAFNVVLYLDLPSSSLLQILISHFTYHGCGYRTAVGDLSSFILCALVAGKPLIKRFHFTNSIRSLVVIHLFMLKASSILHHLLALRIVILSTLQVISR